MARSKAQLVFYIVTPLLLIGIAAGGYLIYQRMQAQHAQNKKELERFGYEMVATTRSFETTGELGTKQLPPTFDEDKLTPTQKVIRSLIRDKENLLTENKDLQDSIEALQLQIAELEEYKTLNERFAPEKLIDELKGVERQLRAFLIRNPDAERFSTIQIETMAAAGAAEYKAYITRNRLMLSVDKKQNVISDYLPGYAFCIGDGIEVAANSPAEERKLAGYFRTEDASILPEALYQDLSTVIEPCQLTLREQLDKDQG